MNTTNDGRTWGDSVRYEHLANDARRTAALLRDQRSLLTKFLPLVKDSWQIALNAAYLQDLHVQTLIAEARAKVCSMFALRGRFQTQCRRERSSSSGDLGGKA